MRAHFLTKYGAIEMVFQRYAVICWKRLEVVCPRPYRAAVGVTQDSSYFGVTTACKFEYFFVDVCVHNW